MLDMKLAFQWQWMRKPLTRMERKMILADTVIGVVYQPLDLKPHKAPDEKMKHCSSKKAEALFSFPAFTIKHKAIERTIAERIIILHTSVL